MTTDQEISELGQMLHQAARASVAQGAQYQPGERIQTNAEDAWRQIAAHLVGMVDARLNAASTPAPAPAPGTSVKRAG